MEWKDPPQDPGATKLGKVRSELLQKPGQWALIHTAEGLSLFNWWGYFLNDSKYETRVVHLDGQVFGKREIYVRYLGDER